MPSSGTGSGGGGGGLALISSQTLGSAAATIAFSSIPGTYKSLLLVWSLRSAVAAETASGTSLRFNGDTAANYSYEHDWGNNVTASASNSVSQTSMQVLAETGPSAVANTFAMGHTVIPFYASTTPLKVAVSTIALHPAIASATNFFSGDITGVWNNTAAITSITIYASDLTSNLAAGSSASLYGMA